MAQEGQSYVYNGQVRLTEGISDFSVLKKFQHQLKNQRSYQDKLNDINVLNQSQQPIIDEFSRSSGFTLVCQMLKKGYQNVEQYNEMIINIFQFLNKVELDDEILSNTELPMILKKFKSLNLSSEADNKLTKLFMRNKKIFGEWLSLNDKKDYQKFSKTSKKSPEKQDKRSPQHKKRFSPEKRKHSPRRKSVDRKYSFYDKKSPKRSKKSRSRSHDKKLKKRSSRSISKDRKNKNFNLNDTTIQRYIHNLQKKGSRSHEKRKKHTKEVGFYDDEDFIQIRYFKKEDVPSFKGLSVQDVYQYHQQIFQDQDDKNINTGEFKIQDRKIERDYLLKMRENERNEREKLLKINEEIQFVKPRNHLLKPKVKYVEFNSRKKGRRIDKENQFNRISEKLGCYYPRNQDIPTDPLPNCILRPFSNERKQKIIPITILNDLDFNEILSAAIKKTKPVKIKESDTIQSKQSQYNLIIDTHPSLPTKKTQPIKGIMKLSKEEVAFRERQALELKMKLDEEERQMKTAMSASSIQKLMDFLESRTDANQDIDIPEEIKVIFKAISKSGNMGEISRKIELIKKIQNDKIENEKKRNRRFAKQYQLQNMDIEEKPIVSRLRNMPKPMDEEGPARVPRISSVLQDQEIYQQQQQEILKEQSSSSIANINPVAAKIYPASIISNPKYETILSQDEKTTIRAQGAQFKTLPCKFYHGRAAACTHDEICTFIHDELYQGLPHPKFSLESQLQAFTKEQQDRFIRLNKQEIKLIQEEFKEAQEILQHKHTKKQAVQQIQLQNMFENMGGGQMDPQIMQMMQTMMEQGAKEEIATRGNNVMPAMDPQQMMMQMGMSMGMPGFKPPPPGQKADKMVNPFQMMMNMGMMPGQFPPGGQNQ